MEAVSDYQFRLRSLLGVSILSVLSGVSSVPWLKPCKLKKAVSLTLQTIVVIAIFNVLAFVIFLNERHSRSLFSIKPWAFLQKGLERIWFMMVTGVWILSYLVSLLFVRIVDWALQNLSFFANFLHRYLLHRSVCSSWLVSKSTSSSFWQPSFWLIFLFLGLAAPNEESPHSSRSQEGVCLVMSLVKVNKLSREFGQVRASIPIDFRFRKGSPYVIRGALRIWKINCFILLRAGSSQYGNDFCWWKRFK